MIGRLNHVAIATPSLELACKIYRTMLGAVLSEPLSIVEHGVKVVFITLPNTKIELMEPLDDHSPIHKFLTQNPSGGIHHLCYEVEDILKARDHLVREGARVLGDGIPKTGAHGTHVLFLHPKDFGGVLIELEEVSLE